MFKSFAKSHVCISECHLKASMIWIEIADPRETQLWYLPITPRVVFAKQEACFLADYIPRSTFSFN